MGLFSSVFGKSKEEPAQEAAKPVASNVPVLSKGLRVNVYSHDSRILLSGRIMSLVEGTLTLDRAAGQLSFEVLEEGTPVHIRGFTNSSTPFDLIGTVDVSNRIQCSFRNVRAVVHNEKRNTFRLPLSIPVQVFYEDDTQLSNPETCDLVNISVGGACFQSEYIHGEGEVLRLKFQVEDYSSMVFLGEIVRVEEPTPGQFRYGFLFAQLDEKESSSLTRILYNVQVGNRREWQRDKANGYWR